MIVKPNKQERNEAYLKSISFKQGDDPYVENIFEPKKKFLIICEGENTEPEYFRSFPVPTQNIIIEGGRNSKNALVDYAISLMNKDDNTDREIWCVFDYDIHYDEANTQSQDFNSAIAKAISKGLKVAWSNDSFELWFLLHFHNLDVKLTRNEYYEKLKKEWHLESFHNEAKTKNFCEGLYELHGGTKSQMQLLAIQRAEQIHKSYMNKKDYANQNPCTTVYLLVKELNNNLKD